MAAGKSRNTYRGLKYLGFVEAIGNLVTVLVVRVYAVGKDWSGSTLRPRINNIEGKVTEALAPYYRTITAKEHHILLFFDDKLDVCVRAVHKHAPNVFKGLVDQTVDVARKVPDVLVDVSAQVRRAGLIDATRAYAGKAVPVAEEYLYLAWRQFLMLPFSPQIVNVASPPALFVGEKANQLLSSLKARNLPLVGNVPLIPLHRIKRTIKKET